VAPLARLIVGLALLAGCSQDPTSTASSGDPAPDASAAKDPLWGTIVLASEAPDDGNPLHIRVEGLSVYYTVSKTGPRVVSYITRRDEDANDPIHKNDFLHVESDVPESEFQIVLSYKRFYHGHYTVSAYADNLDSLVGQRKFSIE